MPEILGVPLPVLAALVALAATAGLASAVQDTLFHHWGRSRFHRWSRGNRYAYWGHAAHVWLRRYRDHVPALGYTRALRTPLRRWLLIPFWDGWHLAKTAIWFVLSGAVGIALAGFSPAALLFAAGFFFAITVPFSLAYRRL